MEIRPIRNDAEHEKALRRVEALWGAPPNSAEGDELEVLATLIDAYESERYPIEKPSPVEAIKFRLEQSGKTYKDLIGVLGQRTRVYEVMREARPLSLQMIRNLHRTLGIPAEILIQPTKRKAKSRQAHRRAGGTRSQDRVHHRA